TGADVPAAANAAEAPPGDAARPRMADTRRDQIFRGAREVMTRKGFAKASVREIAEAAGMPIPTMYKYIRSKEDILLMIYENLLLEFNRELSASVSSSDSPESRLEQAIIVTLGIFDRWHEEVKLLFRESKALTQDARRRVYELDRAYIDIWR